MRFESKFGCIHRRILGRVTARNPSRLPLDVPNLSTPGSREFAQSLIVLNGFLQNCEAFLRPFFQPVFLGDSRLPVDPFYPKNLVVCVVAEPQQLRVWPPHQEGGFGET